MTTNPFGADMDPDHILGDLARQLKGQQIPGGCPDCDAYQTLTGGGGVYVLHVHHDDTCPAYHAITDPPGAA